MTAADVLTALAIVLLSLMIAGVAFAALAAFSAWLRIRNDDDRNPETERDR